MTRRGLLTRPGLAWPLLLVSAVLEAVWATALSASAGFTLVAPTVVFLVALCLSMVGLALAANTIPIGTAYAVWAGIGAALTVAWSMLTGVQALSWPVVLCVAGIIVAVVGLKLTTPHDEPAGQPDVTASAT
ncbi:multidrug efflux SMR transporter [Agrococcus sp. ARC_14]|uniref:DMT family transporter n=1 Tax=Agrococcus sp. ARC_14 TaxID=2919927 RepID=UPI001F06F87E|nr:multidrug efflux SMR transporter [Agrococcus sp. ARC_14]MCH1883702.1 multidrug efflux SMR transporter [Agrococcus sp. ARC_14]